MNLGIVATVASAVLFGLSTPLSKLLVGTISPWLLAGLLYLGSGIGLTLIRLLSPGRGASLRGGEWLWLAGAIALGGVLGPVLLMWGLGRTPGSAAALMLNAEGVLTALLAWFAFHEHFDRRIALGMVAIVAGAAILSWPDASLDLPLSLGPAAIFAACLCWALDNNLTRKVSLADPVQIAAMKGLAAGVVNTGLALAAGTELPPAGAVLAAGVVGLFGYGASLVLFVVGLRHLGTARAGAYFSAAPFVGALAAVILLEEPVTVRLAVAAALMGFGVWLHLTEHHDHDHRHDAVEHDHRHVHDDHHDHGHPDGQPADGEHSHWHRHQPIVHHHPHFPDAHHRHTH